MERWCEPSYFVEGSCTESLDFLEISSIIKIGYYYFHGSNPYVKDLREKIMIDRNINIYELERRLELELHYLRQNRSLQENDAVKFLLPQGYRPVIELRENDRKKRSTASAESWSPAKGGEIVISFEPDTQPEDVIPSSLQQQTGTRPEGLLDELIQLLSKVESIRPFVALKWFRDEALVNEGSLQSDTTRQAILSQAIESGIVLTAKVPNPKAPLYPTTSVRLNRSHPTVQRTLGRRRFQPIEIPGEPLSATILRDRG